MDAASLGLAIRDCKERGFGRLTYANNLVLRSNVVALEIKLKPRRITMEQRTNFMHLAEYIPKIPIKILIGQEGRDTEIFAKDLRDTLTMAGFKANDGAGIFGVNRDNTLVCTIDLANTNESDVIFVEFGTEDKSTHWNLSHRHFDNGPTFPLVTNTNDNEQIFSAIDDCFQTIHFKTEWMSDHVNVKPGEFLILVPVK